MALYDDIRQLMNFPDIIKLMEDATAQKRPAVEPLQCALLAVFGPKQIMPDATKQKIGRIAEDIMLARGYEKRKNPQKVQVVGHVFTMATVYCKPKP